MTRKDPEPTPIVAAPSWQEVHERFQRGLLHRGARYVWAHTDAPSWRTSSVGIMRPAGQEAERLWMLIPLVHLLAPQRLREGVLFPNTVVALAADDLPTPEAVAEIEAKTDAPVVVFTSDGVIAGPRGDAPGVASELRATLAYDDASLAAVDPDAAYAKLTELEREREFHRKIREDVPRVWFTGATTAALVGVWLLQVASGFEIETPNPLLMLDWGACQAGLIASEPWRLLTAGFLHYGLLHLGFNAFVLVVLGRIAERLFGHFAFGAIFLLSVVGALLASCAWNPITISAGASGGVFGVFGAIAGFALRRRADLPRRVFMRLGGIVALLIALNLGLTMWLSVTLPIDNAGHVGGLLIGLVAGFLLARPMPANRPPSRGNLMATAGIVLALVGGYFIVRALPGVVHQRALWDSGVIPLSHRLEAALMRFGRAEQGSPPDRVALTESHEEFVDIRKDAAKVKADSASERLLSAIVAAAEALGQYAGSYEFEAGESEPRAKPTEAQESRAVEALLEFRAAQGFD